MSRFFVDSNILVYAFTNDPKQPRAAQLLGNGPVISVQSLNEFTAVVRRKMRKGWAEVDDALTIIQDFCDPVVPLSLGLHRLGIEVARRFNLGVYDAMIVAAALEAECDTLYSEDMHDGLVIDGRLTIVNPFNA